ncbi:hypothetical protein [Streptomyces sp. ICBB 8177]|uniref:hypothetical protein n=1 Tax=Streptomyces sp. ICBB 8177 TaxID=563922 RepID=UPI000D694659|nr:hypothetical protein [Streptomyces sp. ICBB 8177]
MRWLMTTGWRLGLRLRLGPSGSPGHVLGWRVTARNPFTLSAPSPLIRARNVVLVDADAVTWATLVSYERPFARHVWAAVAPVHHRVIPYLMGRAAKR